MKTTEEKKAERIIYLRKHITEEIKSLFEKNGNQDEETKKSIESLIRRL